MELNLRQVEKAQVDVKIGEVLDKLKKVGITLELGQKPHDLQQYNIVLAALKTYKDAIHGLIDAKFDSELEKAKRG